MSFAIEHLWRCWLWRPIMIFPSCHSPALISSCPLAKIRTKKRCPLWPRKKKIHKDTTLWERRKKKGGGGGAGVAKKNILLLIQLRPTIDGGPVSKLLGTNLDSFEAIWILELDHALDPSLHLGSSNHEPSFLALVFGSEPIDFPSKMVPCTFCISICHFWVLDHHRLKVRGPIYGSHPIGLLYFIGPWTFI
jgi:hypothetical protein